MHISDRKDWEGDFQGEDFLSARFVCPHCGIPSTFIPVAIHIVPDGSKHIYHIILKCNYKPCRDYVYVITSKIRQAIQQQYDILKVYPIRPIAESHKAIPQPVAEDWVEAQKAFVSGAIKAAAVMCRRVLYGIMLEQKCKEHPLHEGIQELAARTRLPQVVEDWLNEIKEEGHDAAHPHRTLIVPAENVAETMGYTKELLRFIYIEPFDLQERLARKKAQSKGP